MNWEYILKLFKMLMQGLKISMGIFSLTLIFAIPLGLIVAVISMSKSKQNERGGNKDGY